MRLDPATAQARQHEPVNVGQISVALDECLAHDLALGAEVYRLACDPRFWAGQPAETAPFGPTLGRLLDHGDFLLIELGPGQRLSALARRHPAVIAGHSAVTVMLPTRAGSPDDGRRAVRAAAERSQAEGYGLAAERGSTIS